jgi:HSP20 family protein
MKMVSYNPWNTGELQTEINRLFNHWGDNESSGATASWMPAVDIEEYTDRFHLFVDLPGVDPTAVEITMDNGMLTIVGDRMSADANDREHVLHRRAERGHGRFYRRFTLPDTVDAENIKASGNNGVLEIAIPKQAKAQPRRIAVAA